jgi:pilus assembly protein FimV
VRNTIKIPAAKQPLGQTSGAVCMTSRNSLWRTPVAAAVLAMALGMPALDAHALALGRVNVQSALGEPLRAEIDVPDINAEEAASLKTTVANGDAFRAAGLEFNPALGNMQISLQRRANGQSYLRLTSDKPINEPFVDLILEASWSSGRIVRDYTMLFDPPNLRAQAAPSAVTAPSLSASPSPAVVSPRVSPPATASAGGTPALAPVSRAPAAARPVPRPAPAPKAEPAAPAKQGSVTVKAGDTANQLAARFKPKGVSLDQMLVAMLSANPDAFVDGNVNRLKKGAVLEMPSTTVASGTSAIEARQTITAQSKDFNEFRRRLAEGAPAAAAPSAGRKASGTVQANVEERKPTATAPDKLTLSKGAIGAANSASAAKASKEESIAKDKQAKDAAARTAELSKNIQDLNKLGTSTTATAAASTAKASAPTVAASAATPGVAVSTGTPSMPAVTASSTQPPVITPTIASVSPATPTTVVAPVSAASAVTATVAQATVTTATVAAVASAPKPTPEVVKAPPPAPPEAGLLDGLLDNPVTLPAAGGLLALLAGFGAYRLRQRKKSAQVDSSFLESRLQPDSFFGASGGQRIDTSEAAGGVTGSSMVYSPSQLDAAGDVDPVAEADVYLAYGRDLQAEEILKEAMRTNPARVAVHAKLLEIYAKRRDNKAFESVANEAYGITRGQGPEWEAAAALGRDLDPANPLYQPGGTPYVAAPVAAGGMAAAFGSSTMPQSMHPASIPDENVDFDLDLDFSSGDDLTAAPQFPGSAHNATSPIHVQPTVAMQSHAAIEPTVDLDFDAPGLANMSAPDMASFATGLDFSAKSLPPVVTSAPTAPMAFSSSAPQTPLDAMEFDLGDLSLDLKPRSTPSQAAAAAQDSNLPDDPLETKLELAQEFLEIGDSDGARSLAQEVALEATGDLKIRAQRMVADLS